MQQKLVVFSISSVSLRWSLCSSTNIAQVKHEVKAKLTQSSSGASGGEGPRTHVQVLANSLVATVLTLLHAYVLYRDQSKPCFHHPSASRNAADVLVVGIIAYASPMQPVG